MQAVFYGTIKQGKLVLDSKTKNLMELYIGTFKGNVRITIENCRRVRTSGKPGEKSNMNGYYWLYLALIEKETGNPAEYLHEYFKRAFLPARHMMILGKEVKLPGTTTELTGLEMMELMEKIEAVTGIPIPPHPNEANN